MKGFTGLKVFSFLLLGTVLLAPAALEHAAVPAAASAVSSNPVLSNIEKPVQDKEAVPAEVRLFAAQVIQSLAGQEGFGPWKNSTAAFDPLGPGTHGWLVSLITTDRSPAGYLIIAAKPEGGLALVEYGTGPDPLYNPSKLPVNKNVLLELLYGGPTLTQWRASGVDGARQTVYYEASGGELLPDTDADWSRRTASALIPGLDKAVGTYPAVNGAGAGQTITLAVPEQPVQSAALFEPDDNLLWMNGKSVQLSPAQFQVKAQQPGKWVFFSSGVSRTYAQSLPISGYQFWTNPETAGRPGGDSILYLSSRSENRTRYVLFQTLTGSGAFKAWTGR